MAGRPGGSVGNLEHLLTLGREFDRRCSHTNWDFPSQKIIIIPNKWRTINSWVHKIQLHGRRGKRGG